MKNTKCSHVWMFHFSAGPSGMTSVATMTRPSSSPWTSSGRSLSRLWRWAGDLILSNLIWSYQGDWRQRLAGEAGAESQDQHETWWPREWPVRRADFIWIQESLQFIICLTDGWTNRQILFLILDREEMIMWKFGKHSKTSINTSNPDHPDSYSLSIIPFQITNSQNHLVIKMFPFPLEMSL